jgi:hypothetical protein
VSRAAKGAAQALFGLRGIYETFAENEKPSTLSREISWSNNALIMLAAKTDKEREFGGHARLAGAYQNHRGMRPLYD